jgi:hypothetical protein
LPRIPDEPIFLSWFWLPSLRRSSAVFRKEYNVPRKLDR